MASADRLICWLWHPVADMRWSLCQSDVEHLSLVAVGLLHLASCTHDFLWVTQHLQDSLRLGSAIP